MKKLLLLLSAIVSLTSTRAQTYLQWTTFQTTPDMEVDFYKGMATDKSGNTYVIDYTQSNIDFWITYRFVRYDVNGVKQWQYNNDSCFTDCADQYNIVIPILDNGAFFIGYHETVGGSTNLLIKRIDINGNLVWQQTWLDSSSYIQPLAAKLDNEGNIIVGLSTTHSVANQEDFEIAKFDSATGNPIWHITLPPDSGASAFHISDIISDMQIGPDNNIYAVGEASNPFSGTGNASFFKVTSSGAFAYRFADNDCVDCSITKCTVAADGSFYLAGRADIASQQVHIEKRNPANGGLQWSHNIIHDSATTGLVGMVSDAASNVYVLTNFNYFIVDTPFGGHTTNLDYVITKFNPAGGVIWHHDYLTAMDSAAPQSGVGGAVQLSLNNGLLYVLSSKVHSADYGYLVINKIDTAGNALWQDTSRTDYNVGALDFDNSSNIYVARSGWLGGPRISLVTQKYSQAISAVPEVLHQEAISVYPNPANNELQLHFGQVTSASHASLYDIQGRLVGYTELTGVHGSFSTVSLAEGVYICRAMVNGVTHITKIVVQH